MTTFDTLGVSTPILRALAALNFEKPTEIQTAAIPILKNGDDVIGVAQTGSGKTAAFVIPLLERLHNRAERPKPGMPRALILAPTRELAIQITETIKSLGSQTTVTCCTVYGGAPYKTQIHILRRGVDILVATPGRLQDHMKQGNVYLDEAEYFVLDEADRMLDMGFVDEVRKISRMLPSNHQSVMFSATMNPSIRSLAETLLKKPVQVEVARQSTVTDNLKHTVMLVPGHKKRDLLLHLIAEEKPTKGLIFVRTRRDADALSDFLAEAGFKTAALHGDKQQKLRLRITNNFKSGLYDFLVATDVAARGLDVKDISHVLNMDVPVEPESYVHRIGRTARGSAHGRAYTLCGKSELNLLRAIENLIKMKIEREENHPFPMPMNQRNSAGKSREPQARKRPSVAARKDKPFADKRTPYSGGKPKVASKSRSQYDPTKAYNPDRVRASETGKAKPFERSRPASNGAKPVERTRGPAERTRDEFISPKPTFAGKKPIASAGKSKSTSKKRPAIAAKKAKMLANGKTGIKSGGQTTMSRPVQARNGKPAGKGGTQVLRRTAK